MNAKELEEKGYLSERASEKEAREKKHKKFTISLKQKQIHSFKLWIDVHNSENTNCIMVNGKTTTTKILRKT